MEENNITDAILAVLASQDEAIWQPTIRKLTELESSLFPEFNIDLWLEQNGPITFQQLADLRYALYHRCSRAEFTIAKVNDREFKLSGRCSRLVIPSNSSRKDLLRKLWKLGRRNGWIGALPKTRKLK